MEREFTVETTTSSTKPTSHTFRVWKKSYIDSDTSIECSLYDLTQENIKELYSLFATVMI